MGERLGQDIEKLGGELRETYHNLPGRKRRGFRLKAVVCQHMPTAEVGWTRGLGRP